MLSEKTKTLSLVLFGLLILGGGIYFGQGHLSEFLKADIVTNYDVSLEKTLLQMPGNGFFTNGDTVLLGSTWLPNGSFVVSGFCTGSENRKGLWAFTEAGAASGTRDSCLDLGEDRTGSAAHNWAVSPNIQPVGPDTFVKENSGAENGRPPAVYRSASGTLNYVSQAYPFTPGSRYPKTSVRNVAAIPGYAVALENEKDLTLYSLPNWSVVQRPAPRVSFPSDASGTILSAAATDKQEDPLFVPVSGVGSFLVGISTETRTYVSNGSALGGQQLQLKAETASIVAYKVQNNTLQLVGKIALPNQTLSGRSTPALPVAVAVDSASGSTKIGFLFTKDGPNFNLAHLAIYEVTATGIKLVRDVNLPSTISTVSSGWKNAVALSGTYIAFLDCGLEPRPFPASGAQDFSGARSCDLAVMNGTQRLTVPRLPLAKTIGSVASATPVETLPPAINGIALSPQGNIVVTNTYGAYLYKIRGASVAKSADTVPQDSGNKSDPAKDQSGSSGNADAKGKDTNEKTKSDQSGEKAAPLPDPVRNLCQEAGGNGCTFSVRFGEEPLGGYGALGCTSNKVYCVRCSSGFSWMNTDCRASNP